MHLCEPLAVGDLDLEGGMISGQEKTLYAQWYQEGSNQPMDYFVKCTQTQKCSGVYQVLAAEGIGITVNLN